MAYTVPSDTHSTGDAGHTIDHNNLGDVAGLLAYAVASILNTGVTSADPAGNTANITTIQAALAAGQVSKPFLCPPTAYAPVGLTTIAITSTTFVAVSSANISTGAFTAPPSGNVLVTASFVSSCATAVTGNGVALAAHGTTTPLIGNTWEWLEPSITTVTPKTVPFLVTGLTPGTSYNLDLMAATGSAADAFTFYVGALNSTTLTAGNRTGPVTMTVQAA